MTTNSWDNTVTVILIQRVNKCSPGEEKVAELVTRSQLGPKVRDMQKERLKQQWHYNTKDKVKYNTEQSLFQVAHSFFSCFFFFFFSSKDPSAKTLGPLFDSRFFRSLKMLNESEVWQIGRFSGAPWLLLVPPGGGQRPVSLSFVHDWQLLSGAALSSSLSSRNSFVPSFHPGLLSGVHLLSFAGSFQ